MMRASSAGLVDPDASSRFPFTSASCRAKREIYGMTGGLPGMMRVMFERRGATLMRNWAALARGRKVRSCGFSTVFERFSTVFLARLPRDSLGKSGIARFLGAAQRFKNRKNGQNRRLGSSLLVGLAALSATPAQAQPQQLASGELKEIAEEAMIYGLPLVMNYAVFYDYFVDKAGAQYKAPPNELYNTARVYTPKDTSVVTPNSDTPYSFVAMDLRTEPFVICNPEIDKLRYFSVQLVDMYTFNYGYMGSRTTGNGAACFLIAGPWWKGERTAGITKIFRSETEFSLALIRTQLLDPSDLENVKKIQAGYRAMPLSKFLNRPAPPPAPAVDWPKVDKKMADADPFGYLAFVLSFCPPVGPAALEEGMRARFAKIGIEAGKPFPLDKFTSAQKAELAEGIKSGVEKAKQTVARLGVPENGWRVIRNAFGDRQMLGNHYAVRAGAALAGIYGNDAAEALYPLLEADADGQKPNTATSRYTITFPPLQLPPTNAFWSVTMYDGKTQLLIDNPINRYLINSPMLSSLKRGADGSITLYLRKDSPGKELESNWLPAPNGPAYVVMRLYWPNDAALNGSWKPPAVQKQR
jgi:hypothetical protein